MFGNLFEDASRMNFTRKLPSPRSSCGLCGIENQGATCYLNSLIQTLLYTPEFRDGIFELEENELGSLHDRTKKGSKVRIIPLQLQRLFARLLLADQQAVSTNELTDSFGWKHNEEMQQHDVQELNRILFSAIETSLIGTSGKNLISHLYHGSTISQIVCQVCGKISEKEEDFLDLNITVAGFSDLRESLNATYVQKEVMKGKNQYKCSMCCKLVDAKKAVKIRKLPPILTFSLLRFCYDISKKERYKETGKLVFPMEIDMVSYCEEVIDSEETLYDLFSIVIHSGSSHGGHYHVYIRDFDCLGKHTLLEEEALHSNQQDRSSSPECTQVLDPIDLIVTILQQQHDLCMPVEVLSSEMVKLAGLLWNKQFKKQHGPINKFLLKNDAVFSLNQVTNTVYLKEGISGQTDNISHSNVLHIPEIKENLSLSKNKPIRSSSFKSAFWDRKRPQVSSTAYSHRWFDFNDSVVRPIHVKDIESQYGGTESAYMLFYRRKSLQKPPEGKENILHKMPSHLVTLVKRENEELEIKRKEYDILVNTVRLLIYFGIHHRYYQGTLQPIPDMVNVLELNIDKRKTLLELREEIAQLGAEFCPSTHNVIHVLHEVPAGLHLYDELSPSQDLESLANLHLTDGSKLFVWNGREVHGETFLIGVGHEPVLLNISCKSAGLDPIEISRGFPKSMTLGEMKVLISSLANLSVEDLTINKMESSYDSSSYISYDHSHDGMSLHELNFLDGDIICATTKAVINSKSLKPKLITVEIENRVEVIGDINPYETMKVEINPTQCISDLVNQLKQQLSLDANIPYRLRKTFKEQPRKPALHENLTITEAAIEDNTRLILEKGPSPKPNQITLMFGIGTVSCAEPPYELTVDQNIPLAVCLKLMLQLSDLDVGERQTHIGKFQYYSCLQNRKCSRLQLQNGSYFQNCEGWHLEKASSCGEPLEPLVNENATLADEGLAHGDYLLIAEGRLPPPGYLTLSVCLHERSWKSDTLDEENSLIMKNKALINGGSLGISHYYTNPELVQLGEVEISSDSTLADLKKQLLTLPKLSHLNLPNICYLRLRTMEGKQSRPGHILRGHVATLRKLKLKNHQVICAQIVHTEENLLQSEILLNVHQRIPQLRAYTPPTEIIWESGKTASMKSLCQTLSENLKIPTERLIVAKYFLEMSEWLVLSEIGRTKVKKKWSTIKVNLRQKPYFLNDGDIIGVKDSISDSDVCDFATPEDDLKKEQREADMKAKEVSHWKNNADLPNSFQPETGIMIHVENFN